MPHNTSGVRPAPEQRARRMVRRRTQGRGGQGDEDCNLRARASAGVRCASQAASDRSYAPCVELTHEEIDRIVAILDRMNHLVVRGHWAADRAEFVMLQNQLARITGAMSAVLAPPRSRRGG